MSFEAIDWVLKNSTATRSTRTVHLVIAHHQNAKCGWAWPGTATIAREAGVSERTVQRAITKLVAAGELEAPDRTGGSGRTTRYRIPLSNGDNAGMRRRANGDSEAISTTPASSKGVTAGTQTERNPDQELTPLSPPGQAQEAWGM